MRFDLKNRKELEKFKGLTIERVVYYTVLAGIDAYGALITINPVRTGNSRWNWWCSIRSIDYKYEEHKNLTLDYSRARNVFASVKAGDTLYIANSTPYIKRLNDGHSKQAPKMFVERTVLAVENSVNRRVQEVLSALR